MALTSLLKLVPFVLAANALFFEPPSARRNVHLRRSNELGKRSPSPGTNFVRLGCYVDTLNPRTLPGLQTSSDTMTNAYCQSFCDSHGFSIAGTEWSRECFCANTINQSFLTSDSECDMTCTGAAEVCGGSARLTVYQNQGTVADPGMLTYGDWKGQGCFNDNVSNRALPVRKDVVGDLTIEKCGAVCAAGGYKYAGVEYASECYCANEIVTDGTTTGVLVNNGCTMACKGDPSETCGGPDRINIYMYTGSPTTLPSAPVQKDPVGDYALAGCYTDDVTYRTLPVQVGVDGGLTAEKCTNKCFSLGYYYAGLEYSKECYCSQAIGAAGTAGVPAPNECTMTCEGDSTEICGGPSRVTIYHYTGTALPPPPTEQAASGDFQTQGCFQDSVSNRALTRIEAQNPLTVDSCVTACDAAGYTYAGLEYSQECYCGNAAPSTAATEGCVMACEGDAAHLCGGPNRLNVYKKVVAPVFTNFRIKITKDDGGSLFGYVAQANGPFILPTYTLDPTAALLVQPQGPKIAVFANGVGTCTDLFESNGPDVNHLYFGAYFATSNYELISAISQTSPGSTRQPTGSTRSAAAQGESCLWTVDPVTSGLSQIWVQDNGEYVPVSQYYFGSGTTGYFMATINAATFSAQFPTAIPVDFTLEGVL